MRCPECNQTVEIKKYKSYPYEGIGVENLFILNAEVLFCQACNEESLVLQQVSKLHAAIGIAVAKQPARLSGTETRFLRRSADFSLRDWSQRIGVAEATYSKWENAHRQITPQADRLARLNFLSVLKNKDPEHVRLADYVTAILSVNIKKHRDFAIAVDADNLQEDAKYLPMESSLLATPEVAFVEARTLSAELVATVEIRGERSLKPLASASIDGLIGDMRNAGNALALAA
jgi:YgiT-type zinc finger domain-containing protein